MSDRTEDFELVKIDTQEKWTAYKSLVEQEFSKRGLEIAPLPEIMPQRSAEAELNDVIDEFIRLWQRDKPLQQIKEVISFATEQFREEVQYLSHNLSFYWSDVTTSIQAISEDIFGKPQHHTYFVKPEDILHAEELAEPEQLKTTNNFSSKNSLKQKLAEKVSADIQQTSRFMKQIKSQLHSWIKSTSER
ncbi:hypothetical protein Xen7305DRAFT_00024210 [Xenococcus sp. PCC 7305]|uniref:hypothetical protein n=1 Tax=Xenococcus sp. PCC 7305 TaxID=102125 RepID=UPI0002ABF483|nr:hypothetical protein [Xenococcus sp. PCC 7305]ELS02703.1 hypothetical protein Xen7305DRAFT_00024210 [Xenococcus sp. PCC 7305]